MNGADLVFTEKFFKLLFTVIKSFEGLEEDYEKDIQGAVRILLKIVESGSTNLVALGCMIEGPKIEERYYDSDHFPELISILLQFDNDQEPVNGYALYLLACFIWSRSELDRSISHYYEGQRVGEVVRGLLRRGADAGSKNAKWLLEEDFSIIFDECCENQLIGSRLLKQLPIKRSWSERE